MLGHAVADHVAGDAEEARGVRLVAAAGEIHVTAKPRIWAASPPLTNRDLRHKLSRTPIRLAADTLKQSARVTRLFRRLHAHGLIAKIPHSRRWRVSLSGRRIMAAALKLREVAYPSLFAVAA